MRRVTIAVLAVLALLATASAPAFGFGKNKINYERFDWHVYKAPHFDVYYYPGEEALLDQVVSYAESQYLRLSQILDHEIKFRISLIYYKTHMEFEQTNVSLGFIPEFVGAFAEPLANRMVVPIDLPPDELYHLLGHELTHVFQFSILYQESIGRVFRASAPPWLMEGMASYLGQDETNLDKMIIRDAVVNGLIPPIHRLNQLTFLTYRYGQAAFAFIEQRYGVEGVRNFVWEFRKSLLTNNIAKPIKDAFGIDAEEFDRQFKKYLQKKYLPILLEKKEAEDYGKEIAPRGRREEDVVNFSPALSPSGELIAMMTTRWEDLDVAIVSAKDGKVFRNLTKGFTNKFEYLVYGAFQGKKDITWSPEGDQVAFFARKENERVLLLYDAVRGRLNRMISIPKVDDELSPSWSPDGRFVAFEGNQGGVVDIFSYELATGSVRNITQDEFYDSNPAWSSDGSQILYNRRIGPYEKIFMVDTADPTRKVQLTFGDSSDLQPSFSRDGKTVYYTSDADGGIYNLRSLSLETGTIEQLTDILGGVFTPLELPEENGKTSIAITSYGKGRFRLFRLNPAEPVAILRPEDQAQAPAELQPFQPPIQLALDQKDKKRYTSVKFHVESAPSILIGVADDGTVLSNAQIVLSDLLGDHRLFFDFQSVSTFSNFNFAYLNLKHRWNWSLYATDFRDYFLAQNVLTGSTRRTRQFRSFTGAGAEISYPLNRYYRIGASASYYQRSIDRPVVNPTTGLTDFVSLNERFPLLSWSLDGDTTRFKEFGPYHGQAFRLEQQYAPTLSAGGDTDVFQTGRFLNTTLDYRLYRRATSRSLFALRLAGIVSSGKGFDIYSMGGLNQLRGYDFREFFGSRLSFLNLEYRFPLLDALAFPFGILRDIRAFLFFDVGSAWFGDGGFYHPNLGFGLTAAAGDTLLTNTFVTDASGQPIQRHFKFWDSQHNKLGDGRASYGIGWNFYLGPFQLTWAYSRQLPNTVEACVLVDPLDPGAGCTITRIDDPFHKHGTVNSFYIAREF